MFIAAGFTQPHPAHEERHAHRPPKQHANQQPFVNPINSKHPRNIDAPPPRHNTRSVNPMRPALLLTPNASAEMKPICQLFRCGPIALPTLTRSELLRLNSRGIPYETVTPSEVMSVLGRP